MEQARGRERERKRGRENLRIERAEIIHKIQC
jgi:hypothetical protein